VVDLSEVFVECGKDAPTRQKRFEEVVRMGVVGKPVAQAGIEVRRGRLANYRVIASSLDYLQVDGKAKFTKHVAVVGACPVPLGFAIGPDRDLAVRRMRCGN